MRARPSTKADKVGRLPIGATVTAHAALGAWLLVSRDEERWVLSTHPLLGALLVDADAPPPPPKGATLARRETPREA